MREFKSRLEAKGFGQRRTNTRNLCEGFRLAGALAQEWPEEPEDGPGAL